MISVFVSTHCPHCSYEKMADLPNGNTDYAHGIAYTEAPVLRVFCSQCGTQFVPESIGCRPVGMQP